MNILSNCVLLKIFEFNNRISCSINLLNILEVLKEAAKLNNREWNRKDIKRLLPVSAGSSKTKAPGFMAFVKSPNMRLKTVLLSINW